MATESMVDARRISARQDGLARNVRRAALVVPAMSLLAGIADMVVELRFGLLAAALILGWTQLVGL